MAQQLVNVGAAPDDGTGDTLRAGMVKINENFTELYAAGQATLTASEAISAGMFVNIHASSGAKIRKANATDATKPCDAYCAAPISNGGTGHVQFPGQVISGLTGLTPGALYFLDTTGGGITATPPSSDGNAIQEIGKALSATDLFFNPVWKGTYLS